jgi:hypothetical protein
MRTVLTVAFLVVSASTLGAQQRSASRFRVALGVASGSTWLEEAAGHTVSSGVAPTFGMELRFPRPSELEYLVGLRASRAAVTVDGQGSYDGDPIYVLDAFVGGARLVGGRLSFRGGVVGALIAGGGDVAPFADASRFAPGIEIGGALRVTDRLPISLALGGQVLRYGGSGAAPTDAEAGAVYRVVLELRHGR